MVRADAEAIHHVCELVDILLLVIVVVICLNVFFELVDILRISVAQMAANFDLGAEIKKQES